MKDDHTEMMQVAQEYLRVIRKGCREDRLEPPYKITVYPSSMELYWREVGVRRRCYWYVYSSGKSSFHREYRVAGDSVIHLEDIRDITPKSPEWWDILLNRLPRSRS